MPRVSSHFALQDPRQTCTDIVIALPATITADSNQTLTPAQLLTGWILRSGLTAGRSDTLPSAASLCEAIQGIMLNTSFDVRIRNTSGQTLTLVAGKGGTLAAGNTFTVATVNERVIRFLFTNITPGTEAYTVYSLGAGAY